MSLAHLVRTDQEIASIRESGRMLAATLKTIHQAIEPGMTTLDADELARREIKALGGKPAFYGYQGFPASVCTSVNAQIVHGIPSRTPLEVGDLASFDCGVTYKGMITDAAFTIIVGGTTKPSVKKLVDNTKLALEAGIAQVKDGVRIHDVSAAVEEVLSGANLGIVRDLVGHGVGRQLHEEPEIPNYVTKGLNRQLLAGMTIAIEPMATLGGEKVTMGSDGWTISTQDNSLSAHFEHTILVTEDGAEVLTEFEV